MSFQKGEDLLVNGTWWPLSLQRPDGSDEGQFIGPLAESDVHPASIPSMEGFVPSCEKTSAPSWAVSKSSKQRERHESAWGLPTVIE